MKTKKILLGSLLAINCLFAGGIPVFDGAQNAQTTTQNLKQTAEWVKEAQRWVDTTKHYTSQLEHYAQEIAAQTGVRDVVSFLKDVKSLYDEASELGVSIQDLDFSGDRSKWTNKVKNLMNKFYEYDYCNDIVDSKGKNTCYDKRKLPIDEIVIYENAGEKMNTYAKNIMKLKNKLAKSKDAKESADINNAIQAEIALMQVEKNQIDLQLKSMKTKKELLEQRQTERILQRERNFVDFSK